MQSSSSAAAAAHVVQRVLDAVASQHLAQVLSTADHLAAGEGKAGWKNEHRVLLLEPVALCSAWLPNRPIQGCGVTGGCSALPSQACLRTSAPHLVGAAVRQRVELVGQVLHAHQLVDLEGDGVALQAAAAAAPQQGWVMQGARLQPGADSRISDGVIQSCGLVIISMDSIEGHSWQLLHCTSELHQIRQPNPGGQPNRTAGGYRRGCEAHLLEVLRRHTCIPW